MTQQEIDHLVASATGENVTVIRERGFGLADPLDVDYDPEPVSPRVLDWDRMRPARLRAVKAKCRHTA